MDIKLLKELNEITREKDEFERALSEAERELDFDLGDEEIGDEEDFDPDEFDYESVELNDDELQRIADHWEEEGANMDDDELADSIGDELEQLDYAPEEISAGIMKVMSMLGREDYFGEPSDEELSDIEAGGDVDMDDELGGSERF